MFKTSLLSLLILIFFSSAALAQTTDEPTNRAIEETITRTKIDLAEKQHRKNIESAGELHSLSKQLLAAYETSKQLSEEDHKKLGKIEKLAKQLRSNQGGGDLDDDQLTQPENLTAAFARLERAAELVEKESRRISRHAVSATLVEQINQVIYLTKTIKKMKSK